MFRSDTTPLCSERFCPLHHGFFLSYGWSPLPSRFEHVCPLGPGVFCSASTVKTRPSLGWFLPFAFWNSPFRSFWIFTDLCICWHHPPQLGQHATTSLTAWLSSALRSPSISSDRHRCLMYVLLVAMNCKKLIHSSLATVILDMSRTASLD